MTRFLQIGLAALSLGAFGSALAQSQVDTTDTRTDEQKQAHDTADQIPGEVPKNPMNTPDTQRNPDTNPVNPPPSDVAKPGEGSKDFNKLDEAKPSDTTKPGGDIEKR